MVSPSGRKIENDEHLSVIQNEICGDVRIVRVLKRLKMPWNIATRAVELQKFRVERREGYDLTASINSI